MIYPTIKLTLADAAIGVNALPPGHMAYIAIPMNVVAMIQIIVTHTAYTQDFSMRGWISREIAGITEVIPPNHVFPLTRYTPQPIVVCLPGQVPPSGSVVIEVEQEVYYLNILNLTNSSNGFSLAYAILNAGVSSVVLPAVLKIPSPGAITSF